MSQRTYAIIGTGALGGFYGARLHQAGLVVHFLLRSDYDHVNKHGLVIESKMGDFNLPNVRAHRDVHDMPPCDVVIIALKTTHNQNLAQLLPPIMKDDGVALVLQNGLGNEPFVSDIVGDGRVMGGLCFVCAQKLGPGHIFHLDYGRVTFAEHTRSGRPAGITPRMQAIATDFAAAGIETAFTDDLVKARWQKLLWNVPFNGLSVVLDATTEQIMRDTHARALAEALMLDVMAGANACNVAIDSRDVQVMLDNTDTMLPYHPSMKVDYDLGQPLEIEAIFANPLRAADRAGAELPRVSTLYRQLKYLENHRK